MRSILSLPFHQCTLYYSLVDYAIPRFAKCSLPPFNGIPVRLQPSPKPPPCREGDSLNKLHIGNVDRRLPVFLHSSWNFPYPFWPVDIVRNRSRGFLGGVASSCRTWLWLAKACRRKNGVRWVLSAAEVE